MWRRAVKHDLASSWFGEPTILDTQTLTQLQANLLKAITQTLALSHKSGSVILGLEAVLSALEERETELVILATDAGGSDKKKLLRNPLTARYCHEFSTRTELGGLFKRRAQVYLAVREGALAQKCTHYLRLYTRFNGCDAL